MSEKKKKYAYWLEPSLVEEVEDLLIEANAISKGDFVRQAIKFYMAYLRQEKSLNFISPLLAQTIKSEIESVERNLSEMMFKVAVEQAVSSQIIAAFHDVDTKAMDRLHNTCSDIVASTNGVFTFKDAYKFQKGDN